MRRYLAIFGATSVGMLLADREFVGVTWMSVLNENNIPFAIRVKAKLIVTTEDGHRLVLRSVLRRCRGIRTFRAALAGDRASGPLWLNFAARRLEGGDLLIIATGARARAALAAYRKRWAIECVRPARSNHVWMAPAERGRFVDAGIWSVAAMYTGSDLQQGRCAPR
jgi:hypothetical protein